MKNPPSIFRISLAIITVAAACFGAPWGDVSAQIISTNNASAAPASPFTKDNPGGGLPGTPLLATGPVRVPALPYGVGEVVKLHQAGIDKDIIVNYINNNALPYDLSADGILYLQRLGMPKEITTALIQRAGQLRQLQASQQYDQLQATAPPPGGAIGVRPPTQVMTPATPAPAVTVIGSDYPVYDYDYPDAYYGGAYDYWPPVIIGGGGWGFGGFRGGYGGFRGGSRFGGGGGAHGGFGGGHGGGHR